MKISVDERSGFCSGVVKAIEKAEMGLERGEILYSLGKIVHNPHEVGRLAGLGLKVIGYEEFGKLKDATVLIRAHGEPPGVFEVAETNNLRLIDATCPVIRRFQQRIRDKYLELKSSGGIIVIFGKKDHPEVTALAGYANGEALVATDISALGEAKLKRPVALFSQTTMNPGEFDRFISDLNLAIREQGGDPDDMLEVHNTICGEVSNRESNLRRFAADHDVVLFVSGPESSNGQALFRVCREVNTDSYFISGPEDLDNIDLTGVQTIGISGATSTPGWLIREVRTRLEKISGKRAK